MHSQRKPQLLGTQRQHQSRHTAFAKQISHLSRDHDQNPVNVSSPSVISMERGSALLLTGVTTTPNCSRGASA